MKVVVWYQDDSVFYFILKSELLTCISGDEVLLTCVRGAKLLLVSLTKSSSSSTLIYIRFTILFLVRFVTKLKPEKARDGESLGCYSERKGEFS